MTISDFRKFVDDLMKPEMALNVPLGQWHTVHALESGSVILEVKDGAYEPLEEGI